MKIELKPRERREILLKERVPELEIKLGAGAELHLTVIHEPAKGIREGSRTRAELGDASRLEWIGIASGEGISEHELEVNLKGKGAFVSLKGLSVLSGGAEVHNTTVVHHEGEGTASRQVFKDVLSGNSRSEYSGLVHVHKTGQKADSDQLNRNLLLSDGARAVSRPQLKIDADDVKCKHGSTTGQLPENELFYLRTRGLEIKEARSLLLRGFAGEILESIPEARVRRELEAQIDKKLNVILRPKGQRHPEARSAEGSDALDSSAAIRRPQNDDGGGRLKDDRRPSK